MSPSHHKVELNADVRTITGRKVKSVRNSGFIPAVLYGKGQEAINLQIPAKDFSKTLKEAGESTLVYLNVDGKSYPTLIHDVERDYINDHVIHADFYKVRLDEKIKAMVPVDFTGESPAVKDLGGIFIRNINELEVEALPQNLPHGISIDISKLANFGDQVVARDIKLEDGVRLTAEADLILAVIKEPLTEEQLQKALSGETKDVSEVEVGKEKTQVDEEAIEDEGATPAPAAEAEKK